ncbi:MAG: histidine kinase [Bacteroidota bacterium]
MVLKIPWNIYVLLAFLLIQVKAAAQFNLNRYNGLPSNHVYLALKDQYGYLWMATDQGVLRYNGYDFKTFNSSVGLGNNDVWKMYRDRKDRIWLFNFANSFGYIDKNKYHKVMESDRMVTHWRDIYESDSGFVAMVRNTIDMDPVPEPGNYKLLVNDHYLKPANNVSFAASASLSTIARKGDTVSVYAFNQSRSFLKKVCVLPPGMLPPAIYDSRLVQYRNHAFFYVRKRGKLVTLNLDDCSCQVFFKDSAGKKLSYVTTSEVVDNGRNNFLHIFYRDQIDKLNPELRVLQTFKVDELTRPGFDGYDIVQLLEDSTWGTFIATESNGAFITPHLSSAFKKYNVWDATGFSLVTTLNDSTGYWWSSHNRILVKTRIGAPPEVKRYEMLAVVHGLIPYDHQHDLLTSDFFYLRDKKSGKLSPGPVPVFDTIVREARKHYFVSTFGVVVLTLGKNSSGYKVLNTGRVKSVVHDRKRNGAWAYNEYSIFYIDHRNVCTSRPSLLKKLGIVSLEKMLLDRYGRMLFKTAEKMLLYHPESDEVTTLFDYCNLNGALVALNDSMLVTAGKFGVAFCRLTETGRYETPVVYHNVKNRNFSFVNDMQLFKDHVLLYTDRGMFTVDVPTGSAKTNNTELPYTLLLQYNDSTYVVPRQQVINIFQGKSLLQFDLIRPSGNGQLKYAYTIEGLDSVWHELNSSELNMPNLEAGRFYNLKVKVKDDVWQSEAIQISVYIKPWWWQVSPGLQVMWGLGILGVVLISLCTALITKKIIGKRAARKNQMLELELKSVYAQINPHFIFNTLNSALHFIKKQKLDDAYNHILRFSQLLRAYLKASRHRYISLSEEVVNLTNYIELQQTRFAHIFSYEIRLEHIPHPETIRIPSLLLQPIVENAINHGLLPMEEKGHLDILFRLDNQNRQLTCIIRDNGIGRSRSKAMQQESHVKKESYGDELISELIHLFNKYESTGIEIAYEDLPESLTGTIVQITIKNLHSTHE